MLRPSTKISKEENLVKIRRISQAVFFMIFPLILMKIFPNQLIITLLPAIITLTLLSGRSWCGWICPLGSILYYTRIQNKKRSYKIPEQLRSIKYILLLIIAGLCLLGYFGLTMSLVSNIPRDRLITMGLLTLISLNVLALMFWCRYICPLGALMGLISRFSVIRRRVASDCIHCLSCANKCPMNCIHPKDNYSNNPCECIVCLDCLTSCPAGSQSFSLTCSDT